MQVKPKMTIKFDPKKDDFVCRSKNMIMKDESWCSWDDTFACMKKHELSFSCVDAKFVSFSPSR